MKHLGTGGNSIRSTSWDLGNTSKYFNFKQRIRALFKKKKKNPQNSNSNMFEKKVRILRLKIRCRGQKGFCLFAKSWNILMYFQGFSWDSELGILREKSTLSFFFSPPFFLFYSGPDPLPWGWRWMGKFWLLLPNDRAHFALQIVSSLSLLFWKTQLLTSSPKHTHTHTCFHSHSCCRYRTRRVRLKDLKEDALQMWAHMCFLKDV